LGISNKIYVIKIIEKKIRKSIETISRICQYQSNCLLGTRLDAAFKWRRVAGGG